MSGYGLLGNRELKRILTTLELGGKKPPPYLGVAFVEDAALILTARVKRDGYLRPALTIGLTLADGARMQVRAEDLLDNPLPRPLQITRVEFHVHKGVLYYFKSLDFDGLKTLTPKKARSYFMETEVLLNFRRARIYTPERLRRGISSLEDVFDRQGYNQPRIETEKLVMDDRNGSVSVRLKVEQGPKAMVRSVREEFQLEGFPGPPEIRTFRTNTPYSRLWVQDLTLTLKTNAYHLGYPDATVTLDTLRREPVAGVFYLDLAATLKSGPRVHVGSIEFKGQKTTRTTLMQRRVRIHRGDLLNPSRVEEGRYRLAQLGVFDTVDLAYTPVDQHTRDILYQVKESKRLDFSLLFGYGSYEMLRGGFETELYDIWGLAHHARLRAIQSFKSSTGEFTYTIPETIGRDVDLFVNGFGLRREEVSFTRLEYGGGLGLHKYFKPEATDLSVRYNYQILSALEFGNFPAIASEGLTNPAVGAIIAEVKHDRRDNPLYPRQGYKIFATVETATRYLGGDANYERVEISPSWHLPLGGGRFLSLGIKHGVDVSFGSPANNLPFNKRFFPGGENSIRGYGEGEASPRNIFGQFVGAETYTLGTVELEQALTPKWSVVFFSDNLGYAERIEKYPWTTGLFSVGAGLRWRTLIGPVRLEYGYNLNPRKHDPTGTLQFSLGFPF